VGVLLNKSCYEILIFGHIDPKKAFWAACQTIRNSPETFERVRQSMLKRFHA
jgi:hypothetical protein